MAIKITFPGGKKVAAEIGNFTIMTDQKIKDGGEETAPAPFEYFLASIGTCAGIYIKGYCESRSIPTDGIEIEQKLVYDTVNKKIGRITLEIQVPPEFPEKHRGAIINAANLCAVKKTIFDPPEFDIKTVEKSL
ncbi:MAG: OsmC family protein [Candidatus Kapaibacterium sp.]